MAHVPNRIVTGTALLVCLMPAFASVIDPDTRAVELEKKMTDEERFMFLHSDLPITMNADGSFQFIPDAPVVPGFIWGIPRLGIPRISETDASLGVVNPLGLREGDVATALPSGLALASTFEPAMLFKTGAMIAGEARAKGYNVLLGPGVNLARDPHNGRNFEHMGEDPLLAGLLGGEASRGIQSQGVVATIKHFAVNAQETLRHSLDAIIDEPALRESDLLAFQIGIEKGDPGAVMCAYNKINGDHACGSDFLLNKVLKGEWGYKGWVMSDWGAVHSPGYINAGLDQQSGAQLDKEVWFDQPLKEIFRKGSVTKERISDAVRRVLRSIFAVGATWKPIETEIDYEANAQVAYEAAVKGIVLLKNNGVLPLSENVKNVLVVGGYAVAGVLSGGGSSQVTPVGEEKFLIPESRNWLVKKIVGQQLISSSPVTELQKLLPLSSISYDSGYDIGTAVALAANVDAVIIFATKWETEGRDSTDLFLPGSQNQLITEIANANGNTTVVLETGNPVLMPWIDKVNAVVEAWYPGQRGGSAIAAVLTGKENPSGRLPITFPEDEANTPHPVVNGVGKARGTPLTVEYREGSEVGYRWYATNEVQPLFPFGHGLSYTNFEYRDFSLVSHDALSLKAVVRVRNTGVRKGADVPQLYLTEVDDETRYRLLGFERVELDPGDSRKIVINVDPRLLANWVDDSWVIPKGEYSFVLAKSALSKGLAVSAKLNERRFK